MFEDLAIERKRRTVKSMTDDLMYIQDVMNRTRENIETFDLDDLGSLQQAVTDLRYRTSQIDHRVAVANGELTEVKG